MSRNGAFDLNAKLREGAFGADFHLVFGDAFGAEDFFDCARIDVHAADDDHVVGAAQDAAFQREIGSDRRRRIRANGLDQVAGAIAEQRGTDAAEVGEDQFAVGSRLPADVGEDFDDVQRRRARGAAGS